MQPLTLVQEEVYEYIKEFLVERHTMPSVKDMASDLGVTDNAIQERLVRLERKGYIGMGSGRSRSITLELHDIKLIKRRV